jgi:hypothetical protein
MCSAPKIPKPPSVVKPIDQSVLDAKRRERSRAASRGGVRSTMLSGGTLAGESSAGQPKTLLGY